MPTTWTPEAIDYATKAMLESQKHVAKPPPEAIDANGKMKANWTFTGDSTQVNPDGTYGHWENRPSHLGLYLTGIAAAAIPFVLPGILASAGGGAAAAATTGGAIVPPVVAPTVTASLASKVLTSPSLWGTVASTLGNVYSANKQTNAAADAAKIAADVAKYGTNAQTKAADEALAFQKQQAEAAYQASETANRANYGQWAAREHRLQSVGDLLGAGPREIPDYVAQPDPNLTGSGPTTRTVSQVLSNGQAPAVNWTADPATLTTQLNDYFKAKGVANTETPYWVREASNLVQRGHELNDPTYADKRLAAADILGGGGASISAPKATYTPYQPQSLAQLFAKYGTPAPITPTLPMPGTVGSYL